MVLAKILMSPLYLVLKILEILLGLCLPCFCFSVILFIIYEFILKDKIKKKIKSKL